MLAPPKDDPLFAVPMPSADAFNNPSGDEDAALLDTGAWDAEQDGSVDAMDRRDYDTNGWFEVKRNPLSKVGVFPYRGAQISPELEPDRLYHVYRPADELGAPETVASFRLLPWIDNHTMLGSQDEGLTPPERKGVQGVIGEDVTFEDGTLYGNIKVFSEAMAHLIAAGKTELSCGYRCRYEPRQGVFDGQAYDFIQRDIRGNHLALVHAGRMGPDVKVLDAGDAAPTDYFVFTVDSTEAVMSDPIEHKPDAGGEAATRENGAEPASMTLEDVVRTLEQLLPVVAALKKHADEQNANAAETDNGEGNGEQNANGDQEPKPDDASEEEREAAPAKPEDQEEDDTRPNGEPAMDEATRFRLYQGKLAARDRLYSRVSHHTGAFDHALMDEQAVAVYACHKLNLAAPKGQELACVTGWLAAVKPPGAQAVATIRTHATDSQPTGADPIARFFTSLKG